MVKVPANLLIVRTSLLTIDGADTAVQLFKLKGALLWQSKLRRREAR